MPFFSNANKNSAKSFSSQKQRIEHFRRYHQVGERVRGKVLSFEGPGAAWVQVEGHPLLASLQTAPQPEETIVFQITQLYPEIVLKELHGQAALSVKELVNQFWSVRYKFDSIMASLQEPANLKEFSQNKRQLKFSFLHKLTQNKDSLGLYTNLLQTLRLLDQILEPRTRPIYWPWLPAWAINHEGFIRPCSLNQNKNSEQMWEACYAFTLPVQNNCFIHLYFRGNMARYRLYLTSVQDSVGLEKWLQAYLNGFNLEIQCLGIAAMPETLSWPFQTLLKEELASGSTSLHVQI